MRLLGSMPFCVPECAWHRHLMRARNPESQSPSPCPAGFGLDSNRVGSLQRWFEMPIQSYRDHPISVKDTKRRLSFIAARLDRRECRVRISKEVSHLHT